MNQQEFLASLERLKTQSPVEINFLARWFEQTLRQLESLATQGDAIKHPRYRGDSRESDFAKLLTRSLPPSVVIRGGFVSNEYATLSHEQDCLLLDSRNAAVLASTDKANYFPIESVLASIEVKSKLTLSELRKIALNCASLRKLKTTITTSKEKESGNVAYFVFSYASSWTLDETATRLNQILEDVPFSMRPSMLYIMNQGLLLPKEPSGFALGPQQLFCEHPFAAQGPMKTSKQAEPTQAIPFLWFLTNIIDHCTSELFARNNYWLGKYVFAPLILQQHIEEKIAARSA